MTSTTQEKPPSTLVYFEWDTGVFQIKFSHSYWEEDGVRIRFWPHKKVDEYGNAVYFLVLGRLAIFLGVCGK